MDMAFAIRGIGVDVVNISRIKEIFSNHGMRFVQRICSADEMEYVLKGSGSFFERLASTFCAKEAVFKSLRTDIPMIFKEIEIIRMPFPSVRLHGVTRKKAEENGINDIVISLAHDGDICIGVAVAICYGGERNLSGRS